MPARLYGRHTKAGGNPRDKITDDDLAVMLGAAGEWRDPAGLLEHVADLIARSGRPHPPGGQVLAEAYEQQLRDQRPEPASVLETCSPVASALETELLDDLVQRAEQARECPSCAGATPPDTGMLAVRGQPRWPINC